MNKSWLKAFGPTARWQCSTALCSQKATSKWVRDSVRSLAAHCFDNVWRKHLEAYRWRPTDGRYRLFPRSKGLGWNLEPYFFFKRLWSTLGIWRWMSSVNMNKYWKDGDQYWLSKSCKMPFTAIMLMHLLLSEERMERLVIFMDLQRICSRNEGVITSFSGTQMEQSGETQSNCLPNMVDAAQWHIYRRLWKWVTDGYW